MVHTGKPSRGCGVCRKRRIKCDEKPGCCSFCERTGQICPGYKNEFDLVWRDQRSVAKSSVQRRTKATERKRQLQDSSSSHEYAIVPSGQSHDDQSSFASVQLGLAERKEDLAICFFFNTYARPVVELEQRHRFMELILPMYEKTTKGSILHNSTLAISTLMLNAWQGNAPDNPLSRSFYLKGLSSAKLDLQKKTQSTSNELLMSVMLLQFYEALISTARWRSSIVQAHLDGALALVRHRGIENFNDPIAHSLLFDVRKQLIENSFMTSQPLAEDVRTWAKVNTSDDLPPTYRLDTINVDIANLHALVSNRNAQGADFDMRYIIAKAAELEANLYAWGEELSTVWHPTRLSGLQNIQPGIQQVGLYEDHCDIYSSLPVAITWNKQRTSLIRIQSILIQSLRHDTNDTRTLQNTCHEKIQQLADDICASIPFLLGDRNKPGGLNDRSVQYPRARGLEISDRHYLIAPAIGGFELLKCMPYLLSPHLELRAGQKQWIGGQIMRIKMLYNLGKGRES